MPLNFNADFRGPKIDIVTREVPIAAIEKVGDILQDRYDKSYEQYNLADEALKNMEASANPVDQEKARELRTYYNAEMQGMLEKGDFHNMRHKTASLARNAALNYRIIGERNQEIQKNVDAIRKDPRYKLDPEGAVKDYLSSIKSVNINPETRTVSDYTIGTYGAPADVSIAEKMLQIAPTLRPKIFKGKGSSFGSRMINGQKVMTIETEGGGYKILKPEEIASELKEYISTDAEVQTYLKRDVKRLGIDPNSEEGQLAYNKLFNERVNSAANALGKMYEINEDQRQSTFNVVGNYGLPSPSKGPFENLDNMQPTQGEVTVNNNITKQIDDLSKLKFNEKGILDEGAFKKAFPETSVVNLGAFGPIQETQTNRSNLNPLLRFIPENTYNTWKKQGLNDSQIRNAYLNHLNKLKKVINTKYTFITAEDQNAMKTAVQAGASGTRWVDKEGNDVNITDIKWDDADVSFYPGAGTYSVTYNGETYYPTTIDPNLQKNMQSAQELIYDFTDLNSMQNIVDVPTVYGDLKVAIIKENIRPDGTYTGYINVVAPTKDGKFAAIPNQIIRFDTKKEGLSPESINSKVRHLLKLSGQMKGIK